MKDAKFPLSMPLEYGVTDLPDGGFKVVARLCLPSGCCLYWCLECPREAIEKMHRAYHAKYPAKFAGEGGEAFGASLWSKLKKRAKRVMSGKALKSALSAAYKKTVAPLASKMADKVAAATGVPVSPSAFLSAYKLAAGAATGGPASLAKIRRLAMLAARGNPKAIAAAYVYKLASNRIPALRRVESQFSGDPSPAPPQGAQNAPLMLGMG